MCGAIGVSVNMDPNFPSIQTEILPLKFSFSIPVIGGYGIKKGIESSVDKGSHFNDSLMPPTFALHVRNRT